MCHCQTKCWELHLGEKAPEIGFKKTKDRVQKGEGAILKRRDLNTDGRLE